VLGWSDPGRPFSIVLGYAHDESGPWVKVTTIAKVEPQSDDEWSKSRPTNLLDAAIEAALNIVELSVAHYGANFDHIREQERARIHPGSANDDAILADWERTSIRADGRVVSAYLRETDNAWAWVAEIDASFVSVSGPETFDTSLAALTYVTEDLHRFDVIPERTCGTD
jgi:hypothetical protein